MYRSKPRPKRVTKRGPQSRRKKRHARPALRDVSTRSNGLYQGTGRVYGARGDRDGNMTPAELLEVLREAINSFLSDNPTSEDREVVAGILIQFANAWHVPRTA